MSIQATRVKPHRKDVSSGDWLAAYLYYAEPWEEFLRDAVKPFVEDILRRKLVQQFFFIRYWERGPHIRLRFKGEGGILSQKVKPKLRAYFNKYFADHPHDRFEPPDSYTWLPNHSIQFVDYEPEVERYGGAKGIRIAEKQFEASSRAALSIISESTNWTYEKAMGAAIQLHLSFAHAFAMDLSGAWAFFDYIFKGWFSAAYGYVPKIAADELRKCKEETLKAFEENFIKQQTVLVPFHQTFWQALNQQAEFEQSWLNQWLRQMQIVYKQLKKAQEQNRLVFPKWFKANPELVTTKSSEALWPPLSSFVHMTNNRLGILNRDEGYLGYLTKRSLEAIQLEAGTTIG
jgi:thiopeptide-type bacteriocin biosynthesis protein